MTEVPNIYSLVTEKMKRQGLPLTVHDMQRVDEYGNVTFQPQPTIERWWSTNQLFLTKSVNDIYNPIPVVIVGGTETNPYVVTITGGKNYRNYIQTINAPTTFTPPFTASCMTIEADQDCQITIRTDGTTYGDTINIRAGQPRVFEKLSIVEVTITPSVATNIEIFMSD